MTLEEVVEVFKFTPKKSYPYFILSIPPNIFGKVYNVPHLYIIKKNLLSTNLFNFHAKEQNNSQEMSLVGIST